MRPTISSLENAAVLRSFGYNYLSHAFSQDGSMFASIGKDKIHIFCTKSGSEPCKMFSLLINRGVSEDVGDDDNKGNNKRTGAGTENFVVRAWCWSPLHVGKGRIFAIALETHVLVYTIPPYNNHGVSPLRSPLQLKYLQ